MWRLETGQPGPVDLAVVERALGVLGLRVTLGIDDRHLRDRERQRDGVHARLNGYAGRRVLRDGWDAVESEVQIGTDRPRGWIDTLGYREADRSLLVEETKADIPDMGDLQRQFGFHMREAREVAESLGWRPRRVVGLDSEALAARVGANRQLVAEAFPASVTGTAAWLRDPTLPPPAGWTLALADPLFRGDRWLRGVPGLVRRRPSAYRDYRDAAVRLGVDGGPGRR